MKKNRAIGIALTLGALAVMSRLDSILSPSVASMQMAFPDADPTSVESIVSIGASGAMFAGLIAGFLLSKLSFKVVGILACLCIAGGGILPIFVHTSVTQLLACAIVVGFGTGAASTMMSSLAARYYKGDKLQSVQGRLSVVQTVGFSVVVWLGGLLAVRGWVNNYYLYYLAIIAFALIVLFAPNETAGEQGDDDQGVERKQIAGRSQNVFWIVVVLALAVMDCLISAILYTKLSVYLSDFNLGDSSVSGMVMMFNSVAYIVVGLLINPIKRVLKNMTVPIGFAFMGIGALLFVVAPSVVAACAGTLLIGVGDAVLMTSFPFVLSNIVEEKHFPLAMGCFACFTSLGFTGSAWFFRMVSDVLGLDSTLGSFQIIVVLGVVMCLVLAVAQFQKRVEQNYLYE